MLKTAIVTGAAQGIGKAIACRLSRDGFQVAINDLPCQKAQLEEVHAYITQQGGTSITIIADVSTESEVKEMIDMVVERMGGIDVMVANAGICTPADLLSTKAEDFQRILSVNALGTFLCYKYAAQQMVKQGHGGRIIGASSVAGKAGWPFLCAYSASKFAVRGMTQSAASELKKYGITINAYAPGPIDTPMIHDLRKFINSQHQSPEAAVDSKPSQESLDAAGGVGFDGQPDDIAGLVSYLASEESRLITGQTVSINGGVFFD